MLGFQLSRKSAQTEGDSALFLLLRKGMSHPKRPRDPDQLAKSIIDIATGSTTHGRRVIALAQLHQ
jgi:hypothetical protein